MFSFSPPATAACRSTRRVPRWEPCTIFPAFTCRGSTTAPACSTSRGVLPFLIRRLTHVLTVSESSKRDIVEYARVPEERVTVTPLAADPEVYFPRDPQEAVTLLSPRHCRAAAVYPLHLAHRAPGQEPRPPHSRLRRPEAQGWHPAPARPGRNRPGARRRGASRWPRRRGFAKDILFTGFVATEDLPLLYQAADLFVFPSLYEGFGLPILEAMACGTPVACSRISSMPEVAGDAAVLFDPDEKDSIASAIRSIITGTDLRKDLAARGLERSKQFSWAKTAAQTLEVIRSVAQRLSGGGRRCMSATATAKNCRQYPPGAAHAGIAPAVRPRRGFDALPFLGKEIRVGHRRRRRQGPETRA